MEQGLLSRGSPVKPRQASTPSKIVCGDARHPAVVSYSVRPFIEARRRAGPTEFDPRLGEPPRIEPRGRIRAFWTALVFRGLRPPARGLSPRGRPGSSRADRLGATSPPDQRHRNHARRRGSGGSGDPRFRLVVPLLERPRRPRPRMGLSGKHRACRMVNSNAGRDPARRGLLDRGPSTRSAGADRLDSQTAESRCRLARLEMAVHLSGSGRRCGQPARRARRTRRSVSA